MIHIFKIAVPLLILGIVFKSTLILTICLMIIGIFVHAIMGIKKHG